MKRIVMIVAFIGMGISVNAQEISQSHSKHANQGVAALKSDSYLVKPNHLEKLSEKSNENLDLIRLKEAIRTHSNNYKSNQHLIDEIYSNPEIRTYIKSNKGLIHSFGFTHKQAEILQEYLTSNGK